MKKILTVVLSALPFVAATSCYKDLSTVASMTIPDITIEVPDLPDTINVKYGDYLDIKPEVIKEGRSDSDFTYVWEFDLHPGQAAGREVIEEEKKDLYYQVGSSPSSEAYILSLTVKDKIDGMGRIKKWYVYVSNSLGEGLIVAYTRDGGQTSDIDFASNKAITYGSKTSKATYVRNLYSMANKEPVQGKINTMMLHVSTNVSLSSKYNTERILIGTDQHFWALDPTSYKNIGGDADLFLQYMEDSYGADYMSHLAYYGSTMTVRGSMYYCMDQNDHQFSKVIFKNPLSAKNVSCTPESQGRIGIFDYVSGKFYGTNGAIFQGSSPSQCPRTPALDFSTEGCEAIAAGPSKNLMSSFLIKDASGLYHLVQFDVLDNSSSEGCYTVDAPDIDKAVTFTTCDNCQLFYYATPDQGYVIVVSGNKTITRKLNFTPDSEDEKISIVKHYQQGWWGTRGIYEYDYEFPLETNRLQLLIVTYNEKSGEGKIYLRPFNVSTGLLTMNSNGTLGGFGEITAVTATSK